MQRSLRLISLSNYVFVLEISQISGIVQNVSMLIMVVMRIVAAVGEQRRNGEGENGCHWTQKCPSALNPFIKYGCFERGVAVPSFIPQIHWENVTFASETSRSLSVQRLQLFLADHKKGLL